MIGVMPARCLSIHAGYACRRSGACCSGVFAIPAEPEVVQLIRTRGIPAADPSAPPFVERNSTLFVGSRADGACAFYGTEHGGLCGIQRRAGAESLPSACRHFPRLFLRDGRGLSVTLSHYCPTAASRLLDDVPLEIVHSDTSLGLAGDVEAFEADGALPPLLRPDVLTDLEGFDAWERAAVAALGREDLTSGQALDVIASATEMVRTWKPGGARLAEHVGRSFASANARARPNGTREWGTFDRPVKRYLAAKVFANRIAYEGRGLRSMVAWLGMCLDRLRSEIARAAGTVDEPRFIAAIRAADLALVHRTDTAALARDLAAAERPSAGER